jgi:hypothetical protein
MQSATMDEAVVFIILLAGDTAVIFWCMNVKMSERDIRLPKLARTVHKLLILDGRS